MPDLPAAARALETRLRDAIPPTRAIDLHIDAWDGDTLVMGAPLAPNVNDKGCAFGGSLTSVMTVAGWALVMLALDTRDIACDVFVGRSEVVYRAPVWKDFRAHARLDDGADWNAFFAGIDRHGKARINLRCHITETGADDACATLTAAFVAKRHAAAAPDAAQ